jgi:hypothetical protein
VHYLEYAKEMFELKRHSIEAKHRYCFGLCTLCSNLEAAWLNKTWQNSPTLTSSALFLNSKSLLMSSTVGILWLPRLRFFHAFSSVVSQMPGYNSQRRHGQHSSQLVNCVVLCIVCVTCVFLCIVCV